MKTTKYFPDKRQRNKNHLTNVFNPTFFFLTKTTKRIYLILSNLDRSEAKTLTFINYKDKECFFSAIYCCSNQVYLFKRCKYLLFSSMLKQIDFLTRNVMFDEPFDVKLMVMSCVSCTCFRLMKREIKHGTSSLLFTKAKNRSQIMTR